MRTTIGSHRRPAIHRSIVVGVALALAVLTACGGPSAEEKKAQAAASASAAAKVKAEKQRAAKKAAYEKCQRQLGSTMRASEDLDSRLSVGMAFADYTRTVGNVRVQLDKIEALVQRTPMPLSSKCLGVAVKLEAAANKWTDALNQWNDCIGDFDCDMDAGTQHDAMQKDWGQASRLMAQATTRMGRMQPQ